MVEFYGYIVLVGLLSVKKEATSHHDAACPLF